MRDKSKKEWGESFQVSHMNETKYGYMARATLT
jgi:hypothetical protein